MLGSRVRSRSARAALVALAAVGALVAAGAASANVVQLSGSMEGAVQISPDDNVAVGYIFTTDAKSATTIDFVGAQVTFSGNCSTGGTGALTISIPNRSFAVSPGGGPTPTGDEKDPASFEGSTVAPSTMCPGGGKLDASKGASFSADIQSTNTTQTLAVQFHYRDPNAKGKGNYDCSASTSAALGADVCGASWSGTAHLTPDAVPPPTCAANQTLVNGVCQNNPPTCAANQTLVNGVCQTNPPSCAANQTLVNGVCQTNPPACTSNCSSAPPSCTSNCSSPPPSCTSNCSSAPACTSTQTLVNGVCQNNAPTCLTGQTLMNGICENNPPTCTTGQMLVNGSCVTAAVLGKAVTHKRTTKKIVRKAKPRPRHLATHVVAKKVTRTAKVVTKAKPAKPSVKSASFTG